MPKVLESGIDCVLEDVEGGWCTLCPKGHRSAPHVRHCERCGREKDLGHEMEEGECGHPIGEDGCCTNEYCVYPDPCVDPDCTFHRSP